MSGSQTKAEIQTLQQNINHILGYMASNYMDSLKGLWESIYRSYASNMSAQRKKEIVSIEESGESSTYGFKKNEFISSGEVYITIKSKAQEDIKQKQDFAVLLSTISLLKASVTP
jgi:putative sterol carrier protein